MHVFMFRFGVFALSFNSATNMLLAGKLKVVNRFLNI